MTDLRGPVLAVAKDALNGLNVSAEDRKKIAGWLIGMETATNADDAQGFADALSLKVAEYEIHAAGVAEKALWAVITRVASVAVGSLL